MPLLSRKSSRIEVRQKESLLDSVKSIFYAIIIALVFRSFLFEPFHIPSGSMRANLLIGDYIFVTKYAYGYSRYSFPFGARINFFDGRLAESEPERGDVVVFRLPSDTTVDYVKRVIGLPGDRIQVTDGKVILNGDMLQYERVRDFSFQEYPSITQSVFQYEETLPSGRSYRILDQTSYGKKDNTPEYIVPDGHVFVMGDNRDNSVDSRYQQEVGFIPIENILGRADLILFSMNKDVDIQFWEFWRYLELTRDNRSFVRIH